MSVQAQLDSGDFVNHRLFLQAQLDNGAFLNSVDFQYYAPTSDITTASWQSSLGGSLFAAIDETTPDDSDYIFSPSNPTTQEFEVKFGPINNPGRADFHTVRYRLQAIGQDTTFVMTLMCGATQIAQWTESVTVAQGATTFSHTLTSTQAGNITDYTNLRLRGKASA